MVGGYQIIDFKNKELLDGVGMVFEGVYDLIEGTRKPILITNFNFEGKEYKNTFLDFVVDGSAFKAVQLVSADQSYNVITVEDTDVVTVTSL